MRTIRAFKWWLESKPKRLECHVRLQIIILCEFLCLFEFLLGEVVEIGRKSCYDNCRYLSCRFVLLLLMDGTHSFALDLCFCVFSHRSCKERRAVWQFRVKLFSRLQQQWKRSEKFMIKFQCCSPSTPHEIQLIFQRCLIALFVESFSPSCWSALCYTRLLLLQ